MTKNISLADDAYKMLQEAKREGESFSDLTRRLVTESQRHHLLELIGTWSMSENEADRMIEDIYRRRDESMRDPPRFQ